MIPNTSEVMDMIRDFFENYFWSGIKHDTAYNWIDMPVYALLFVGAIWLIYTRVFEPKKITIDRRFIAALIGWIIFASAMRAMEDAGIVKSVLLITPFSYITDFMIAFSALMISRHFNEIIPYWKSWGVAGYVLGAALLVQLPLRNFSGIFLSTGIWAAWIILFWILHRLWPKFLSRWNFAALSAQMFDTSSVFTALTYFSGFQEKHVLGNTVMMFFESRNLLLINGSASWFMFALKLAIIPAVLYAIDKYGESEEEKKFLKMIIILLGLAMGLRNTLGIGMA